MLGSIFVLMFLVVFMLSFAYFLNWFYASTTQQDVTYFTTTQDGWKLAVHRYRPKRSNGSVPVILCHGLSANRFIFDMEQAPSLACYLREQGYDVWLPELRGSGMSDSPGLFSSRSPYSWGYDHHLNFDVPAIIEFVTKESGSEKVKWVGHSMGGMLIYSYLASHNDSRITCVTTLGAPIDFSRMTDNIFAPFLKLAFLLRYVPLNPLPFFGRLLIPVITSSPNFVHGLYYKNNIDPHVARSASCVGTQLLSASGLWIDMANFMKTRQFLTSEGEPILDKIQDCTVPIYVIAGSKDVVAPSEGATGPATNHAPTVVRQLLIAGVDSGFEQEYGHVDLLLGLRAQSEIYPRIHSWLLQF